MTGQLLTVEEVAERLGMTRGWVWAQVRADRIPHVRLGRYRRFRKEAIDEWLLQLEQGGASDSLGSTAISARRPRPRTA
jgi:excisionase family DNA binding protein